MNIRVEVNSLATNSPSGIGYFTKRLTESLIQYSSADIEVFSFNFLNRQPTPNVQGKVRQKTNQLFPLRVYAKLQSHGVAPPFDLGLKPVDLTIFTNFAHWPSVRSKLTATTIHDLTYLEFPDLVETNNLSHLKRIVKKAVHSSDFIITVSEAVKHEVIKEFSVDPSRILVISVPPDESFYVKNDNEIHKKYSIPTKKYLYFISTIEPRKNIPLLIEAYALLPKELQNTYSLVLSGGMGWKSEASTAALKNAQEKGLKVIHTGYIDEEDKSALFQQASAFVFPSIYEGFGMPILEAAASKTPIITTDIPVLREAASDGAEYFAPNNVSSLVDAIKNVLNDPVRQKELVQNATKHLSTFSWKENVVKIVNKAAELEQLRKNH